MIEPESISSGKSSLLTTQTYLPSTLCILDGQDPYVLVTEANLALSTMKTNHDHIPPNILFMSDECNLCKVLAKTANTPASSRTSLSASTHPLSPTLKLHPLTTLPPIRSGQTNRTTFEGQRTTFMILTFPTAKDANKAIKNNLYILGKRRTTRKLLPEPHHCHSINTQHIATTCKEISDICNSCGGAHLSRDCSLKGEDPSN